MEELPDLCNKYNFSKNRTEAFSEEISDSKTNAEKEEKIIENLIRQLTHSVPESIPSHGDAEKQNADVKLQDPPNLDEILETDDVLITPTSHNVTVINAACQQVLKQMEYQLLTLLKKNRKEQDIIQVFLNTNCKTSYCENSKKISLKCAGMPYFKDHDGFPAPPNEDVLRKKRNAKLLPIDFIQSFPIWNSTDAKNLINALKKYDISKPSTVDWMKISATDMEGKYSPSECKCKWTMHLNPTINKSKWSSKETELLKALSAKCGYQDWDKIAAELGTNRTGLQCCIQYQTHTFPTEGKWTKEEDETLKKLVEKYRIKDYIPWSKVVWYFENRSLKQCQERYAYHLGDIKKGNFTIEEDFVIVYLASKLKNFGEVAKFLPRRVSTQIRSRYEYLVELSMPKFSKEEDELLTKLMVQYPRNWRKISENFINRSRVQCRKRWAYLQKKIQLEDEIHSESDDNENFVSASESSKMILNYSQVDTESLKKNIHFLSKPSQSAKKCSEVYSRLLDYHKYCHKFLFGPKSRVPTSSQDLKKLTTKLIITMNKLSVTHTAPLGAFNVSSLSNNCEFDKEDLMVLNDLSCNEQKPKDFELSKKFIPPNFMTLLALRTFTLAWNKIKNLCNFYSGTPHTSPTLQISSDDRILCSDAKKLFKSRLKSIFAFPLILSNISPSQKERLIYKPKARKPIKPLSKRKRKEHAKFMSAAYRNKMKSFSEQFRDSDDVLALQNDNLSETNKRNSKLLKASSKTIGKQEGNVTNSSDNANKISRKRSYSSATECAGVAPLKKRPVQKRK